MPDIQCFDGRSVSALIFVGTNKLLGISRSENRDPGFSCPIFSSGLDFWSQVTIHHQLQRNA